MSSASGVAPSLGEDAPAVREPPSSAAVPAVRFAASSAQSADKIGNDQAAADCDADPDVVYVTKDHLMEVLFQVMGSAAQAIGASSDQETQGDFPGTEGFAPAAADIPMRTFGKAPAPVEEEAAEEVTGSPESTAPQASAAEINAPAALDLPAWAVARAPAEAVTEVEAEASPTEMLAPAASEVPARAFGTSLDEADADAQREAVLCPSNHELLEFATPDDGWSCSMCAAEFPTGRTLWGCRQCDYDVCGDCWKKSRNTMQTLDAKLVSASAVAAAAAPEESEAARGQPAAERTSSGADFWRVPLPDLPDDLPD
mmetsp:Transcript_137246/g.263695  ORF Transcript_137246/g.263695 Transcript_137246/m.263695 type:complete len:314 (+) Transcript_137246:2-943(+)